MRPLTRMIPRQLLGRLSTRRRNRLAPLAVLLLALLASGGIYAAVAPANAGKTVDDAATIEKGRQLFLVGCASCHGKNGEGIVTKKGSQYGPSLAGVGAAAVAFQVGTGRMPMAVPGTQAPRKKVVYSEEEIEALSAFVASLGPGPAVPSSDKYDASKGDVTRGGQFFRTNCTACHNFDGAGGAK